MSWDSSYLSALVAYQEAQYLANPPSLGEIGLIRFGKLQEDPTAYPAIALMHFGDRDDPGFIHEMIVDQVRAGGGTSHRIWGGYMEIGSTANFWWHRFTEELICYQINTSLTRDEAMAQGMTLAFWVANTINQAQEWVLHVGEVDGMALQQVMTVGMRPREGGGPDNYIWKVVIRFQALVHHVT